MFTAVKDFATSNNALRRAPQPSASAKEEGVEGEPRLLLGPCTFRQTKSITMYLDAGFRLLVFSYLSSAAIPFHKIIFINEKWDEKTSLCPRWPGDMLTPPIAEMLMNQIVIFI